MRIVITGAQGQLGTSLQEVLGSEDLFLMDLPQHDVTQPAVIDEITRFGPDLVIHAAAMTDVDGCELDPETAYRVNALGTQQVALACQRAEAAMLYISTDYVFDGRQTEPYWEFDRPNPLNVYGASKLAGEWYVQTLLEKFYIVRTAWLYSRGGNNFVSKVLRLAEERPQLSMVTSEVGSPTYAPDLAAAMVQLILASAHLRTGYEGALSTSPVSACDQHPLYGIYHLTNQGRCSRYQFAQKILEYAGKADYPLIPIEEYPRPARVPACAELRNFCAATLLGLTLRPWEEALRDYFQNSP
ncbi:MAG: dTDP-4-dehydrorhamnose reductase [Anaerolineae bacterium]